MKILIAEDDRLSRSFLEECMKDYGTCDSAVDGMAALDCYLDSLKNKAPYDLLCLDIMMPKVDGLKVLTVIRNLERQHQVPADKHLKIIMMTAVAEIGYIDRAFQLGCDAYASKPLDIDKIREVMQSLGLLEQP